MDEPVLTIGYQWPDGAEVVDAYRTNLGWRALVHWPTNHHPWCVTRVNHYPEAGWVRHSTEAWSFTRAEAEDAYCRPGAAA